MLPLHLKSKSTGCSSARFRVLVWGASGRKFESCHPDSDNQGLTRKCKSIFYCILPFFYLFIGLNMSENTTNNNRYLSSKKFNYFIKPFPFVLSLLI